MRWGKEGGLCCGCCYIRSLIGYLTCDTGRVLSTSLVFSRLGGVSKLALQVKRILVDGKNIHDRKIRTDQSFFLFDIVFLFDSSSSCSHALLHRAAFPLPRAPVVLPAHLQVLLDAPVLLNHQSAQPFVLRLQLPDALLQLQRLVLQVLGRLLEGLFALLLLDAEARRGGGVAAPFVFFGREAGGGGFGLRGAGVVVGGWRGLRRGWGQVVLLARVGGWVEALVEGGGGCGGGV